MRRAISLCAVVVSGQLCLSALPALASDKLTGPPTRTFYLENDLFTGTDRFYTNGAQVQSLGPTSEEVRKRTDGSKRSGPPWWLESYAKRIRQRVNDESGDEPLFYRGFAITHTFYTPQDITVAELIPDDRPYGGWLRYSSLFEARTNRAHHRVEGSIGVIGELSMAEEIQKKVHEIVDSKEPRGWDNQLGNEPAVHLFYRYRRIMDNLTLPKSGDRIYFDAAPHAVGVVGNPFTYVGIGATVRFGYNLPPFYSDGLAPVAPSDAWMGNALWFFVKTEGRGMLHNIFLDGSTFSNSHSVDKKFGVADLEIGAAVRFLKRFTVSYRAVTRTREFDLQDRRQSWGSLSVSVSPKAVLIP